MKLTDIKNGNLSAEWAEKGYELPKFDVEAVKAKQENLSTVSQKMGSAMYAAAQAASGGDGENPGSTGTAGSSSTAGAGDDDVVDAEIIDEDERK